MNKKHKKILTVVNLFMNSMISGVSAGLCWLFEHDYIAMVIGIVFFINIGQLIYEFNDKES